MKNPDLTMNEIGKTLNAYHIALAVMILFGLLFSYLQMPVFKYLMIPALFVAFIYLVKFLTKFTKHHFAMMRIIAEKINQTPT